MRISTLLVLGCILAGEISPTPTHAQQCDPRVVYSLGGEFGDGDGDGDTQALVLYLNTWADQHNQ